MNLEELKNNWEQLGESDAYWAVLTNSSKINNNWDIEEFYESGRSWVNIVFEALNLEELLTKKCHALDFGCGPGRLSQGLCHKFENVVGIDISSSMIKKANQHNKFVGKCTYAVNSTNDLSQFESNQFDFIFSFLTLQHIEKKYTLNYIKEFSRVVKKGGYILLNIPSKPPLTLKILSRVIGLRGVNLIRQIYYRKKAVIEMHWIEKENLKDYLDTINLEVVKILDDKGVGEKWDSYMYLLKKPT